MKTRYILTFRSIGVVTARFQARCPLIPSYCHETTEPTRKPSLVPFRIKQNPASSVVESMMQVHNIIHVVYSYSSFIKEFSKKYTECEFFKVDVDVNTVCY